MICRTRNILFIHIPKTAGTSIEHAMFPNYSFSDTADYEKLYGWDNERSWLNHLTLRESTYFIKRYELSCLKAFAVVRNPWDRIVSEYEWKKELVKIDFEFEDFLTDIFSNQCESIFGLYRSKGACIQHLRPQTDFLGFSGIKVQVVHFEEISFIEQVSKIIRVDCNKIGMYNQSNAGFYRDYYSKKLRYMVSQIYAKDIAKFSYRY